VQVLNVHMESDEICLFTVTDGTSFTRCVHFDEDERHITSTVKIVVSNPSPELKKIRVNVSVNFCFSMLFKFPLPCCDQTIYTNIEP
jgi:hypothetical protein